MKICIWSYDDGYGDGKLYNGRDLYLIPSYATYWRSRMRSDIKEEDRNPLSYIGVEVDGVKYLAGQGALDQDASIHWAGGDNKHVDQMFPVLLKACLGVMAGGQSNPVVEPLVMGLPVKADEKDGRHELLQKLVVGEHKMLINTTGQFEQKTVTIKELVTKKQPFLSYCDVILDKRGQISEESIAGQFCVIIDIGSRTLNVYTLDSLEPIADLSDTTNQGMYTAYDMVSNFIEENLGFPVSDGKMPVFIKKGSIRGVDLSQVINRCYEALANEIARVIHTMFVNSWAYVDRIFITGGGSELLRSYLEGAFPVTPVFLDRFATSRGGWKFGVRHALKSQDNVTISLPGGGAMKVRA